jgi:hypothetical protein
MHMGRIEFAPAVIMNPAFTRTIACGAKPTLITAHNQALISRETRRWAVFALGRKNRRTARQKNEEGQDFFHHDIAVLVKHACLQMEQRPVLASLHDVARRLLLLSPVIDHFNPQAIVFGG